MMADQTIPYKLWDLTQPDLPPRSRLYHLEPIGVGTAQVESLTSYLSRLARAHSVSVRKLARLEMVPLLDQEYPGEVLSTTFSDVDQTINGARRSAIRAVLALEKLTMRNDLRFLTMWSWNKIVSSQGLLRSVRAWCPACYDEWYQAGKILYDPLLWALDVVKVCPQHYQSLNVQCPYQDCQTTLRFITSEKQRGYCLRCKRWLGVVSAEQESDEKIFSEEGLKQSIWQANVMGELLAAAPFVTLPPPKEGLAEVISTYVENMSAGNVCALARTLGVPPDRLYSYLKETGAIQLDSFLDVCYRLEISPLDLLTDPKMLKNYNQVSCQGSRDPHSLLEEGLGHPDLDQMQHVLATILASDEDPLPPLSEIARRLEQAEKTLHNHFPDLCRAIIERRQKYQKAERLRIQQQLELILAGNEIPPLTLRGVTQQLECNIATLRRYFPDPCRVIVERRERYQEIEKVRIQHELEAIAASDESPPLPLNEVARWLEQPPNTLRRRFPDLCREITERHQQYQEAEKGRIQCELETIVTGDEIPPPSMSEVARRLKQPQTTLYRRFLDLCGMIVERYQRYQQVEKLRVQQQLEAILANDEAPPPSLSEVARRLEQRRNGFYERFPDLCQAIVERRRIYYATKQAAQTIPITNQDDQLLPVDDMVRYELEAIVASDEDPLPSPNEIARRFEQSPTTLRRHFPDLCRAIVERRQTYRQAEKLRIQQELGAIVASDEDPPPSLRQVALRLACHATTLSDRFPDLCRVIVDRHQAYREIEKLRVQQELEAIVTSDEIPPPPLREVARRLKYESTSLRRSFPDLCRLIMERHQKYHKARKLRTQQELEAILANNEVSPPSLSEVARQLEQPSNTLRCRFPDLCQAIVERYYKYQEAEKLRIKCELEAVLADDETPPRPLSDVARRLDQHPIALHNYFPDLSRAIVERRQRYQEAEQLRIRQELEAILASDEDPPPSLSEVTRQLGCSPSSIYNFYPELTRDISRKYLTYHKNMKVQRLKQLCAEVRQVTFQIHQEGLYPSRYQVAQRLVASWYLFSNPEVCSAWREALHELGLSE